MIKRFFSVLLTLWMALIPSICLADTNQAYIISNNTKIFVNTDSGTIIKNAATLLATDGFTITNINPEFGIVTATKKYQKKGPASAGYIVYNTSGFLMGVALSIFTLGICAPVAIHYGVKLSKGSLNSYDTEVVATATQQKNDVLVKMNFTDKIDKQDKASAIIPVNNLVYDKFFEKLEASLQ